MGKLNRKDILLLLLYVPGVSGQKSEGIKGITRFTKLLFLLKDLYKVDEDVEKYYHFEPYKIGPFTEELYNDLNVLEAMQLIETKTKNYIEEPEVLETQEIIGDLLTYADLDALSLDYYKEFNYSLTERGQAIAGKIYDSASQSTKQAVEEVKLKFGSLPLTELLRYIYRRFPEMATRTIREDLRGK
jgi:hypothetical protein